MKKLAVFSIALLTAFSTSLIKAQPTKADTKKETRKEQAAENKAGRPPLKKLDGKTVSQDSQTSFYMTIGYVPDITWSRSTNYDEAAFTKDGLEMKAYFDGDGQLVGTTTKKAFNDLPQSLQKKIEKLYGDYTIGQVIFFKDNTENATDMTLYGVQFEGQDSYFIELSKGDNKSVVMSDKLEDVSLFKQL